ncbi:glycosyltransferase family 39 protein [Patescibacteria group bacterium]|nr:glycosyltransferase family 39 protein [Patescibacteria group bacterium]
MNLALALLFAGAFLLRLVGLHQSLWLDEATTARAIRQFGYAGLVSRFSPFDFHPPLYYWLIKGWSSVFGLSEAALRLPSVIAALLAGYGVYLIGKAVKNQAVGFWATVFFLVNPLIVYYSQEARMYMLVTLFLVWLTYAVVRLESQPQRWSRWHLVAGLTACLSLLTFYGAGFYLASLFVLLILKKRYRTAALIASATLITGMALFPLLRLQLANARATVPLVKNWSAVLGKATLKNLVLIPIKFSSGRISFSPKPVYYLLAGIWLLIVGAGVANGVRRHRFFAGLLFAPIIFGWCASFITPLLQYFRFLYLLPVTSVLLAIGAGTLPRFFRRIPSSAIRLLIGLGLGLWSLAYLVLPQFHRDDWKNLAAQLPRQAKIYMIVPSADALLYYRPDIRLADVQSLNRLTKTDRRLTVIPYTTEIYGVDYRTPLRAQGYRIVHVTNARGLSIEYWEKI